MGYPWKWEILTDFWPSKGIYSHHSITCKILPIMTYGWRLWFNETSYCKVGNQLATCEITILISRDLQIQGKSCSSCSLCSQSSASPWLIQPSQASAQGLVVGMGEDGKKRVPSKLYSCSELVDGHRMLVASKKECDSPRTLAKKIQESSTLLKSFAHLCCPWIVRPILVGCGVGCCFGV